MGSSMLRPYKGCPGPVDSSTEMLMMLAKEKLIRHSRDVVASDDVARVCLHRFLVRSRHRARRGQIIRKKLFQTFHGAVAVFGNGRVIVDMSKQESLQRGILCGSLLAEAGKPLRELANFFRRGNT